MSFHIPQHQSVSWEPMRRKQSTQHFPSYGTLEVCGPWVEQHCCRGCNEARTKKKDQKEELCIYLQNKSFFLFIYF